MKLLITICLVFIPTASMGMPLTKNYEKTLIKLLTEQYQRLGKEGRPVDQANETLSVRFGVTLLQILNLNYESQTMEVSYWNTMQWTDVNLKWKPSDFGGIKSVHMSPKDIFIPDIAPYNAASKREYLMDESLAVVQNDGLILYIPSMVQKFACEMPHHEEEKKVTCQMKFGSWTYNGLQIDLISGSVDVSNYVPNPMWELVDVKAERHVVHYECCPEPYVDITCSIALKPRHSKLINAQNDIDS